MRNIKLRRHCNYGGIHLNTLGCKILVDNFILALNTLAWHRISQKNDAFDKDNPKTESYSKFPNNLSWEALEGKGKSHINFENHSFSFLKKTKSKHPKNSFFGHLNINLIRNKFESVQKIIKNTFDIFLYTETKIDSSSQASNLVSRSPEFFEILLCTWGRIHFLC